jgi:hypothetical protein
MSHAQNNKDRGRRPVTGRRKRVKKRERERREGSRGLAEAGRAGGRAEMKAELERKPDTKDVLGEHSGVFHRKT